LWKARLSLQFHLLTVNQIFSFCFAPFFILISSYLFSLFIIIALELDFHIGPKT
jgi:hypothetical protein